MTDSHSPSPICSWRVWAAPPLLAVASLLLDPGRAAAADDQVIGFVAAKDGTSVAEAWKVLGNPGSEEPTFSVQKDSQHGSVLRLHATGDQSDGIFRPVDVDLSETPQIHFAWKVTIHPDGQIGTAKDDAAVQIHLDFGRRGLRRQVLTYVFDPRAQVGRCYDDSTIVAVNRAIVLNSGAEQLDQWISHSRNVFRDFRACYGSDPPQLQNISIFCDSNDSNSEALGFCTELTFTKSAKPADEKADRDS